MPVRESRRNHDGLLLHMHPNGSLAMPGAGGADGLVYVDILGRNSRTMEVTDFITGEQTSYFGWVHRFLVSPTSPPTPLPAPYQRRRPCVCGGSSGPCTKTGMDRRRRGGEGCPVCVCAAFMSHVRMYAALRPRFRRTIRSPLPLRRALCVSRHRGTAYVRPCSHALLGVSSLAADRCSCCDMAPVRCRREDLDTPRITTGRLYLKAYIKFQRNPPLDPTGRNHMNDLNHVAAVTVPKLDGSGIEIWVPCGFHGDETDTEISTE